MRKYYVSWWHCKENPSPSSVLVYTLCHIIITINFFCLDHNSIIFNGALTFRNTGILFAFCKKKIVFFVIAVPDFGAPFSPSPSRASSELKSPTLSHDNFLFDSGENDFAAHQREISRSFISPEDLEAIDGKVRFFRSFIYKHTHLTF